MTASVLLMPFTGDQLNYTSEEVQADGWYGFSDGLHTVSIFTNNFTGRVRIQASLALVPQEGDWFDIWLTPTTPYAEFPLQAHTSNDPIILPTPPITGDTLNVALNFRANVLWVRAKMERDYLNLPMPYAGTHGAIKSILMSR